MLDFRNSKQHFGLIAIAFHWIMALLLISLILIGLYMVRIPISLQKLKLFGLHKEFGMLALLLVTLRLGWRAASITPTLAELPRWEVIAARSVHYTFYFLMFALPLTGWMLSSSTGLPVGIFGIFVFPDLVQANEFYRNAFINFHQILGYILIAVIGMHAGAAFKHLIINRDKIMQRMLWP
jgi:cytochrome b561